MTTTPKPPLDFTKVEALRKHMLLTTTDMSQLLGVSRMTYYGWTRGKSMRKASDEKVRVMLKKLLTVMTDHNWPTPDVIAANQTQRRVQLNKLLNQL